MITVLWLLKGLRWMVPTVVMVGSAPYYLVLWGSWRTVSTIMPRSVYCAGDEVIYSLYQRMILYFYEVLSGAKLMLSGDICHLRKSKENVIFICNHQSTVDWMIADMLALRQGSLGQIRYILKDGLRYIPVFGFYFRQHNCVYVKRGVQVDLKRSSQQIAEISRNVSNFWMVIFPEGTRYNAKTLKESSQFSENNNLPSFRHVLFPRHKAFSLCVSQLSCSSSAVYDVTIAYGSTRDAELRQRTTSPPGLADYLNGDCSNLHIHLERIPIKAIPKSEEGTKQWLVQQFVKKDRLLENFYLNGKLGEAVEDRLPLKNTLIPALIFASMHAAVLSSPQGRAFYLRFVCLSTVFGWIWVTFNC